MHTGLEQVTEPISCNVAIMRTRLSVETNVHVYSLRKKVLYWSQNPFGAGAQRIYGWRRKRKALETDTLYSKDEIVENARSLHLAFDRYCLFVQY